jgi:hypothetical protein
MSLPEWTYLDHLDVQKILDGRVYNNTHPLFFFGAGSRAATIAYGWKSESASDVTYPIDTATDTNLIKNILKLVLCQSGALDVFYSTQLLRHTIAILLSDGLHLLPGELFTDGRVIPKISLGTDDQTGHAGAVVVHLGKPLLADVFERGRRCHREADQEDICLRVGKGAETIIILLTGGIEQSQGIRLIADPIAGKSELVDEALLVSEKMTK